MKVWIDGAIVDGAQARVPVCDHGLLYGDGVFEGIRIYAGRAFRLAAHLRRLQLSGRAIGLELPLGATELREVVASTFRATGLSDAYVRLLVTRGDGPLGVDPTRCLRPRVVCIVDELEIYPAAKLERGLELVTVSVRRDPGAAVDPRVKSLNYLTSVLAKREAVLRGADEALLLNTAGAVAEAAVANLFARFGDELHTPPATDGALAGVTRQALLELAPEVGLSPRERSLGRMDLLGADEVLLSGSGVRLVPVATLDAQPLGSERRALTTLTAAFARLVEKDGVPLDAAAGAP